MKPSGRTVGLMRSWSPKTKDNHTYNKPPHFCLGLRPTRLPDIPIPQPESRCQGFVCSSFSSPSSRLVTSSGSSFTHFGGTEMS